MKQGKDGKMSEYKNAMAVALRDVRGEWQVMSREAKGRVFTGSMGVLDEDDVPASGEAVVLQEFPSKPAWAKLTEMVGATNVFALSWCLEEGPAYRKLFLRGGSGIWYEQGSGIGMTFMDIALGYTLDSPAITKWGVIRFIPEGSTEWAE